METKKQTFIVIYKPGSAWLAGKPVSEQPLKEHGKYLLSLYKLGVLRFAGPFEDDTGGAVVLEVSGEDEAKNIVKKDPAVINHIFSLRIAPLAACSLGTVYEEIIGKDADSFCRT